MDTDAKLQGTLRNRKKLSKQRNKINFQRLTLKKWRYVNYLNIRIKSNHCEDAQ